MTTGRAGMAANDRRLQEAGHWFVEHESGRELSPAESRQWDRWRADPDNTAEYDEFALLYEQLRSLPRPPLPSEAELKADSFRLPDDHSSTAGRLKAVVSFPTTLLAGSRRSHTALAACTAILVCAGGFLLVWRSHSPSSPPIDPGVVYASPPGDHRQVVLADGSIVTLARNTVLRAGFVTQPRVAVLERGEALFQVQRDPRRPFRVFAGNGSIKAIGTEFDVRRYSERIQVAVTEGVVEVVPQAQRIPGVMTDDVHPGVVARSAPFRVVKGEEVTYGMDGSASAPRPTDLEHVVDRIRGLFVYRGSPLREVIDEVQPDFPRQIILDASIAGLQYTGTIKKETLEQWVRNLPLIYPVEVVYTDPNSVLIRPRR